MRGLTDSTKNHLALEHDVLELDRFVPQARGANDLVSRTRHCVPSAVHGRAWTKNRENNPMQSRVNPGSQPSCCAASGAKRAVAASHYAATGLKVIRPGSPALR
jgi:hypothetical protein